MNSEIQSLQSGLYEILDLFSEIKTLNPNICSGNGLMSEELKLCQSGYLYLQACGADGTEWVQDEGIIAEGIHLRWALRKNMAENHIPKGNLANTGQTYFCRTGYSKQDDYVTIRKTPYINRVPASINLTNTNPYLVKTMNGYKRWVFNVNTLGTTINNKVYFHFYNLTAYNSIGLNPLTDAYNFLAAYQDYIEIEVENKLFFRVDVTVSNMGMGPCDYKYESVYVSEPGTLEDIAITTRKSVNGISPSSSSLTSENMRFFRIRVNQGKLDAISLETYYDFINSRTWNLVDDFGLTIDDTTAANRLMGNDIDDSWPRYNEGTKVKAANYTDKWSSTNGLKEAVIDYLDISRTDTRAYRLLNNDDSNDESKINMSYVDMLNLVSLDFHIARMFGLGHIEDFDLQGNKYVYLAEYYTSQDLPFNPSATLKKHLFMSLPTDKSDKRLPQQPVMDDLSFGLPSIDNCNTEGLVDEDGYSRIDQLRYINVNRDKYDYEVPYEAFFATIQNFDTSQIVKPVFYGIEYRADSESGYRKPEITSDPDEQDYFDFDPTDSNGIAEIIPVPEKKNPLFTHEEKEDGLHHYAIYGINWFNRTSQTSSEESATTSFTVHNKLVPPVDIAAHYIQVEKPRLFTSLSEQDELAARIQNTPNADNLWTRVTFNWTHVQKMAYQTADELEFFFRPEATTVVKGKITGLTPIAGGKTVWVQAGSYKMQSSSGNELIEPVISSPDFSKFVGSGLVTNTGTFQILEVATGTTYPKFRIKKLIETRTYVDPDKDKLLRNVCIPVGPEKNEYFTIYENLGNVANWTKLDKTIELVDFSNTTETILENDGSSTEYHIGGINDTAEVMSDDDITPGPDPAPIPGLYRIRFLNENLPDHPQQTSEHVFWEKGIIRIPEDNAAARMRSLQVLKIESRAPVIVVWAIDAISDDPSFVPVKTGSSINVNFHPGYKVYLEPESNNDFDNAHMMPEPGEEKRVMLLAVRSKHVLSNPTLTLVSEISVPAALFSLDIAEPKKPNKLVGPSPLYATRPDIQGKSSFTFDTEITAAPFALIPYRCHDTALFAALYEPETIEDINSALDALDPNTGESQRFYELVNLIFDNTAGHEEEFSEYDGYRFPFPDKEDLFDSNDTFTVKKAKIKAAIEASFIPVLEQPAIHQFIKSDGSSPENVKPVMRDLNGVMLDFTDPLFNPFPNIRKFTASSKNYVRFSDFGLDGGTKNIYFYALREMSKKLEIGEMSEILGPVSLVNTFPPEAPGIRKIQTVLADTYSEIKPGIQFEINPYFNSEDVKKIRIYRTIQKEFSESVRTMELAGDFEVDTPLKDEFPDLNFPPFGKDIYYRLVALRKIKNEFEEVEYVPSKPSEIRVAKVVDNVNPPSPAIIANIGATLPMPPQLQNVDLNWLPTCFEGKYYLYKMSASGMWQLVQQYNFNDSLTYHYNDLPKEDDDGDTIYHRFKVVAENVSGLLSLDEKVVVL